MTEVIDEKRRRFIVASTTVVGGIGAAGAAVPFIASMQPNAGARAEGAPVDFDVSTIKAGQQVTIGWRGKPVWILHPNETVLQVLPKLRDELRDPDSEVKSQQPAYAVNEYRSTKPEYFVAVALCTHLSCVPAFRPDVAPRDLGPNWRGGYFCPCHGSRFDLAGRVYRGVPAPTNLVVPPHSYLSDTVVRIGVEKTRA